MNRPLYRLFTLAVIFLCCSSLAVESPAPASGIRHALNIMAGLLETNDIESRAVFSVPASVIERYVRDTMKEKTPPEDEVPADFLLTHWRAFLYGNPGTPDIRMEMSGMVFKAGPEKPVRIHLAPVGTVFTGVSLNGRHDTPMNDGKWHFMNVTNTGAFDVKMGVSVAPAEQGARKELSLFKRGFAVSTVDVNFREPLEVLVPGQPGRVVGTVSAGTIGCIVLGRAEKFSVFYGPVEPRTPRPATPSLAPSLAWTVGEKLLSASAILDITLLAGNADRVTLVMPEKADNIRLTGSDVKEAQESAGKVTAFFKGALSGKTVLRLSFDMPRAPGSLVKLPELEIQDGRIDNSGWIAVAKDAGGELLEETVTGAEAISAAELPADMKGLLTGSPLYAYKRTAPRTAIVLDHVATTPFPLVDTIADRAEITCILRPSGEELCRALYTMRNNRKQFLRVRLPADAQLLAATVDGRLQNPSGDGADLLVPLVKSIQTLEGLVSFPVELIYARHGPALQSRTTASVDVPELQNVPVAVLNMTLFLDKDMEIRSYSGALTRVTGLSSAHGDGMTYGYRSAGVPTPAPVRWKRDLAANYYRAGYEAYRSDRLEEAEEYLGKARTEAGAKSAVGTQAEQLRLNIKAARGEIGTAANRDVRAKASQIQRELSQGNTLLEAQQTGLIRGGVELIQSGNDDLAIEMLNEAEELNRKIGQRGGSARDLKSKTGQYSAQLKEAVQRKGEKDRLTLQLHALQQQAHELTVSATNALAAKAFSEALKQAAEEKFLDLDVVQQTAFNNASAAQQPGPNNDVEQRVLARQMRVQAGQTVNLPAAQPSPQGQRASGPGANSQRLTENNDQLKSQIYVLEQAIVSARNATADSRADTKPEISKRELDVAFQQIGKARERLRGVARQIDSARAGQLLRPEDAKKDLTDISTWCDAYGNSYGWADDRIRKELADLKSEAGRLGAAADEARKQNEKADYVAVNLSGIINTESTGERALFERFLNANYLPQSGGTTNLVRVEGNNLLVRNNDDNGRIMAAVAEKLRDNAGLVVDVAGRNRAISPAQRTLLQEAAGLPNQTPEGKRYGVVDEAQYRTILQLLDATAVGQPGLPDQVPAAGKSEIVVGTVGTAADQRVRIARSGADYNGVEVGGATVNLPHNQYLVVDSGGFVTILKAGAARNWQAAGKPVLDLQPEMTFRIDIPDVGVAVRFEKTLLAAGESPDMTLTYSYKQWRR